MPLISVTEVGNGVRLGLWRMTENPADCGRLYQEAAERFKSDARRLEYICVRMLLGEMCHGAEIVYESCGRPRLADGRHIGISHTRGICSVIVSEHHDVAVDIETVGDRVCRVAGKFMRQDEFAPDVDSLLVHWCAKETVYKLFPEDNLQFHEIRLLPAVIGKSGYVYAHQCHRDVNVRLSYVVNEEFVMTYAADI